MVKTTGIALDVDKPVDLAALGAVLASDATPTAMQLSELDGFLTGIVVGPELIMPSEWLPLIWGEDEPVFKDAGDAAKVLGLVMGRYNEIARGLDSMPPRVKLCASPHDDGGASVYAWCEGFAFALTLRAEAWEPLISVEAGAAVMPILALCRGEDSRLLLEQGLSDDPDEDIAPEELMEMVPSCVVAIAAFWRQARTRGEGVSVESFGIGPKAGRAQAPAGKGRKKTKRRSGRAPKRS